MPKYSKAWGDPFFKGLTFCFASVILLLTFFIASSLVVHATPAIFGLGWGFLWETVWDPIAEQFGALPFLYGTLITSAISLVVAAPLGLGAALFLSELTPRRLSDPIAYLVDLLAAIPSVIYGIVGLAVLVPLMQSVIQPALSERLGFIPLFAGAPYGVGMLTAGLLLGVMILPFIISVSREMMLSVPQTQREAILSLGATRWEMIAHVVFPFARAGIIGSLFTALARALGETMAVTMVIGNSPEIRLSLFEPGHTIAAVIANEFTEATSDLYLSALIEVGAVLFFVSFMIHGIARFWVSGKKI